MKSGRRIERTFLQGDVSSQVPRCCTSMTCLGYLRAMRTAQRGGSPVLLVFALVSLVGCGFEHGSLSPVDSKSPDDVTIYPVSCNAIHETQPTAPDGTYFIDPDGTGGDAPLAAVCDMSTEGGGWTLVFFPPTSVSGTAIPYTTFTPRLLSDSNRALLTYRGSTAVAIGDRATFNLPAAWKSASPLSYATMDVMVDVVINGAGQTTSMLRFGYEGFNTTCSDPWLTPNWGRICIANTKAPFFAAFAVPDTDGCTDSQSAWDSMRCASEFRFSIAVR
jgi:hypothetical protein